MMSKISDIIIIVYISQLRYVFSQGCIESERSPSNPVNAQCDTSFFELDTRPFDPCICCTPSVLPDDNPPDECRNAVSPTTNKTDVLGTLICNENFDCCTCSELICSDCTTLQCSGDNACIGIQGIFVDGDCTAGAIMSCNGDVSCFRTKIEGECMTNFDCNGDNSCGQSMININQNIPVPLGLTPINFIFNGDKSVPFSTINAKNVAGFTCGGDNSCNSTIINLECRSDTNDIGCKLRAEGDNSAPNSKWTVDQADLVLCSGDGSCENSLFNITCVLGGCDTTITGPFGAANAMFIIDNSKFISCNGEGSCISSIFDINCLFNNGIGCLVNVNGIDAARHVVWNIDNPNSLKCTGDYSCGDSTFIFDCVPNTGCPIMCSGACPNSEFILTNSNGIMCTGKIILNNILIIGSCENSVFKLDNNIGGMIDCVSDKACQNAIFTDSLSGPIINVMEVRCNAPEACEFATFNIMPGSTSHFVSCNGMDACKDFTYLLTTELDTIKGFSCNGMNSCDHTDVNIIKTGENPFNIEGFSCGSMDACIDQQISVSSESDVSFDLITCSGANACKGTSLTINLLNPGKFVTLWITCNAIDSCSDFTVNITENADALNPDILDIFDIQILGCTPQVCFNSTINGIPFTSF